MHGEGYLKTDTGGNYQGQFFNNLRCWLNCIFPTSATQCKLSLSGSSSRHGIGKEEFGNVVGVKYVCALGIGHIGKANKILSVMQYCRRFLT